MSNSHPNWMKGKKRVDAKRRVSMNITQSDIDGAVPGDGESCVAALCALRAFSAAHVYFYKATIYVQWDEGDIIFRYKPSGPLYRNVIRILDDPDKPNSDIQPGVYDLLPPPPGQRLGLNRSRKPGSKNKPKVPYNPRKTVAYARIARASEK